jgi:hypothetical protein
MSLRASEHWFEFDYIPLNLKLVLSFEAEKAINLFNKVNLGCTKQSGKAHRGGCGRSDQMGAKTLRINHDY